MDVDASRALTGEELDDLIYKTWKETPDDQRAVLILSAVDPEGLNMEGVYLEVILLDDNYAVVRDRWLTFDANYEIVRVSDVFDIFRSLVDAVEAQKED